MKKLFFNFLLRLGLVILLLGSSARAYAQKTEWLHDITLYSNASKDKLINFLGDFSAKQARAKRFGDLYLGRSYYHFELPNEKAQDFLKRLRSIGEFTYDLRESKFGNTPGYSRFVIWHLNKSYPSTVNVFSNRISTKTGVKRFSSKFIDQWDDLTIGGPLVFEENEDWENSKIQVRPLIKNEKNSTLTSCDCDLVITWAPNPTKIESKSIFKSKTFSMPRAKLKEYIVSLVNLGTTKIWKSKIDEKLQIKVEFVNLAELQGGNLTISGYLSGLSNYEGPGKVAEKNLGPPTPQQQIDLSKYALRTEYEALMAEIQKLNLEIQALQEVISRIPPKMLSRVPTKMGSNIQFLRNGDKITTTSKTTTSTTTTATTTQESTITTEIGTPNQLATPARIPASNPATNQEPPTTGIEAVPSKTSSPQSQEKPEDPAEEGSDGATIEYLN